MTGPPVSVVMVASARDIVDASGKPVVREHGLGGLSGRVPGTEAIRRSVIRGANIFGEPCCVLMRRDLATTPGSLAAFRLSSTQWSVTLARQQAESAAEMRRQIVELVPGLLSAREVRVGNARATLRAFQRRLLYIYLGRRMRPRNSG